MLRERAAIRDMVCEARPDVVNAHWAYEYGLGALATDYPTVVTVHDWAPAILRYAPIPYWMARQAMYFACVRRAAHLTTVSPYLQRRLESVVRRPATLIPNGIAADRFRTRTGDQTDGSVILSVINGFSRMKNVSTLLEAFAMVRSMRSGVRLRLAGPGFESGGGAEAWARLKGLDLGVEFLGPVPNREVDKLLDEAVLLVHPSKEESFGMTLVEAMARRTPVVAGKDAGAVPWVLGCGSAGALVDVGSARSLAAGVMAVLSDEELRLRYSAAGYARARALFALERVAAQYEATFTHVVSPAR
jgi:glycosyltransferase involved in cell wall biosynthesis